LASFSILAAVNPVLSQETELPLAVILQKADSVSQYQDSLLARSRYKVQEEAIFSELDGKGRLENSDTSVAEVVMRGREEVSRTIIYSSRTPAGEKKESKEESFSLSFNDPRYNFSLTDNDDTSYKIAVSPKAAPPGEGDISGTVMIDRRDFHVRQLQFEVPNPKGALKEFQTEMSFEPLEGGLVVLREVKMAGFAKAFLGIFKIRFSGVIRYSKYEMMD